MHLFLCSEKSILVNIYLIYKFWYYIDKLWTLKVKTKQGGTKWTNIQINK